MVMWSLLNASHDFQPNTQGIQRMFGLTSYMLLSIDSAYSSKVLIHGHTCIHTCMHKEMCCAENCY
jgi:hypothetical protein